MTLSTPTLVTTESALWKTVSSPVNLFNKLALSSSTLSLQAEIMHDLFEEVVLAVDVSEGYQELYFHILHFEQLSEHAEEYLEEFEPLKDCNQLNQKKKNILHERKQTETLSKLEITNTAKDVTYTEGTIAFYKY